MAQNFRISPTIIKIAVVVLLIKELWLLLGIPSFTDAVLSFLTVGAVPGTNRTLTPDEMYKLLAGVGIVFVLLVFRKDIARLFWRKHDQDVAVTPAPVPVPAKVAAPRAKKAPVMPLAHPAPHLLPPSIIKRIASHRRVSAFITRANALWQLTTAKAAAYYASGRAYTIVGLQRVWTWIKLGSLVAYRLFLLTVIILVNLAIAFWKWAEPRIRHLDKIIEKKVHSNEYTAGVVTAIGEIGAVLRKVFDSARAIAKDLVKPREN